MLVRPRRKPDLHFVDGRKQASGESLSKSLDERKLPDLSRFPDQQLAGRR